MAKINTTGNKQKLAVAIRDAYKVEALEQRILLSADPVFGSLQAMLQRDDDGAAELDPQVIQVIEQLQQEQKQSGGYYQRSAPADLEWQLSAENKPSSASQFRVTSIPAAAQPANDEVFITLVDSATPLGSLAAYQAESNEDDSAPADHEFHLLLNGEQWVANLDAGSFVIGADQTFSGSGVVAGDVRVEGLLSPGYSPGVLAVEGNLDKNSNTKTLLELGGTSPGTGDDFHDQINVTGTASLAGTLDIELWKDFIPEVGDEFVVLNYGSVQGQFD